MNSTSIVNNTAYGYSITWDSEFFDIIAFGNQLCSVFRENGFEDADILDSGYYDEPEYAIKWELECSFLEHPIVLEIIETKHPDKEDLSFELDSGHNRMTNYQMRWLLHQVMLSVKDGKGKKMNTIVKYMLQNKPISDEDLFWEK